MIAKKVYQIWGICQVRLKIDNSKDYRTKEEDLSFKIWT